MSLSIWRLLRGPNNDWPLTLCDYRAVNPERDSLSNDILFREETGEKMLLKYNGAHRWYYMSDQDVDDDIGFRNTHTNSPKSTSPKSARRLTLLVVSFPNLRFLGAWHASFFNSGAGSGQSFGRESIEVRVAAFT